jgi:tetraacyldisaccharide 4'-kinase
MSGRTLWPLLPLVPVYAAAQALDSATYARGWRHVERLRWPVVSVGNLSVGGAGKTPLVIALARTLTARGWQVDVLSRGYGRTSHAVEQVDQQFAGHGAARYGDEPWLIAQEAQVPVFLGTDRVDAGRMAEQRPGVAHGLHLLDDGMQHRRLARDVEMVVLHRSDFYSTLLPVGRLREPLAALERADFVVLRQEDTALADRARRWMRSDAAIWRIRRELELPTLPGTAVVFNAIAHPADFHAGLRGHGVEIAAAESWRDHHRFTDADVERLCLLVAEARAACLITTGKDAVRLSAAQRAALERTVPLVVARLSVHLEEPDAALEALEVRIRQRADAAGML